MPSWIRDLEAVQQQAYERLHSQIDTCGVLDPSTPQGSALSMCLLITEHVLETDVGKPNVQWYSNLLRSCADLLNPVHPIGKLKGADGVEASLLNFRLEVLCSKQLDEVKKQRREDGRLKVAEEEIKALEKKHAEAKAKIYAKVGKKVYRKSTKAKAPRRTTARVARREDESESDEEFTPVILVDDSEEEEEEDKTGLKGGNPNDGTGGADGCKTTLPRNKDGDDDDDDDDSPDTYLSALGCWLSELELPVPSPPVPSPPLPSPLPPSRFLEGGWQKLESDWNDLTISPALDDLKESITTFKKKYVPEPPHDPNPPFVISNHNPPIDKRLGYKSFPDFFPESQYKVWEKLLETETPKDIRPEAPKKVRVSSRFTGKVSCTYELEEELLSIEGVGPQTAQKIVMFLKERESDPSERQSVSHNEMELLSGAMAFGL